MRPRQTPKPEVGPTAIQRGRATRERLLEAAVSLVGEVGWSGVTTRLVAERAGVNPGLVHYHFGSVSDLLVAACVGFARELLGQAAEQLAAQSDVAEGVDWLLAELSGYTGTDPASVAFAEALLAAGRLPELREGLARVVADFRTTAADWLRERTGAAGAGADAAAVLLAAALDGLVLHRALEPGLDVTALGAPLRRMLGVSDDTMGAT